jgi:16S rRNA (cytosine967-C5)-methyltransferase
MRDGGKIDAAIIILDEVMNRHQPVKTAVRDWGKRSRYAGAKDRAWVSGLVLDALRRRNSLAHAMGEGSARALVLGALRFVWGWGVREIEAALKDDHAPPPLSAREREGLLLAPDPSAPAHVQGDFPDWLAPHLTRVFGPEAVIEAQAMAVRAHVDLRVNTLKADAEKAAGALRSVGAVASPLLRNAFQIPARDPTLREESLEAIPAFSRGWVEVQDGGSQIASAASGVKPGDLVLDYCAGGGGKTLAMAAMLEGSGQVYSYDIDGRRLSALVPRLQRSGATNVQLVHPREPEALEALRGRMDVVFVDAPCSGTGTWRRKPDTKWRLRAPQLSKRMAEQDAILAEAATYVKPGGRLVYATCSFLIEEDEDRVEVFLEGHPDFMALDGAEAVRATGLLTAQGEAVVKAGRTPQGSVRLTPRASGTDGFFFAVMKRLG